jgi:high-affinity nickel-transport protein
VPSGVAVDISGITIDPLSASRYTSPPFVQICVDDIEAARRWRSRADVLRIGLLVSALGFGLRHGVDWDHIAAIGDITGSQQRPRRAFLLATMYAVGHALVVIVLGGLAIAFSVHLPDGVDAVMERIVGVTLLVLGAYVVYGLARDGRRFRLRSRWMLVFALVRRFREKSRTRTHRGLVEIEHEHPVEEAHFHSHTHARVVATAGARRGAVHRHRHIIEMPADPFFAGYGAFGAFGIGLIHGVGAETPTQVLVFATAAGANGTGAGFAVLVAFVVGLLISNTIIAVAATFGFVGATRNPNVYVGISALTAVFSLVLGVLLVVGNGNWLPEIIHG